MMLDQIINELSEKGEVRFCAIKSGKRWEVRLRLGTGRVYVNQTLDGQNFDCASYANPVQVIAFLAGLGDYGLEYIPPTPAEAAAERAAEVDLEALERWKAERMT